MSKELTIKGLNLALTQELESIHQYFIYHRIMEHQGYNKLAPFFKRFSVEEMKHADTLMGRILFLGGNLEVSVKLIRGTSDIEEMFRVSMEDERDAMELYNNLAADFEERKDYESSNMITDLLKQEEIHFDWHRKQLAIVKSIGIAQYMSEHIGNGYDPD